MSYVVSTYAYSGLLRCHLRIRLGWCLSHVKGHSSHALLRGLDGVTLVRRRELRRAVDRHLTSTLRGEGGIHDAPGSLSGRTQVSILTFEGGTEEAGVCLPHVPRL